MAKSKLQEFVAYGLARMGESSTWQGLGFIATLAGVKWAADIDWGSAAALGGLVSGLIKTFLPDTLKGDQ